MSPVWVQRRVSWLSTSEMAVTADSRVLYEAGAEA